MVCVQFGVELIAGLGKHASMCKMHAAPAQRGNRAGKAAGDPGRWACARQARPVSAVLNTCMGNPPAMVSIALKQQDAYQWAGDREQLMCGAAQRCGTSEPH